jgi:hypothetical protein
MKLAPANIAPATIAPATIAALALLAAASFSCRSLPYAPPHLETEYGQTLKRWTRTVTVYHGLETRAFVRVIALSPEMVTAEAAELSHMRAEPPDLAAETLARLREEYRQPTFFAIVYTSDRNANDWNEPGSVWRVALNLGLGERAPDRILRYEAPYSPEMKALYPYIDDYSVAYRLRFPEPSPSSQETNATTAQQPAARAAEAFTPAQADLLVAGSQGKMNFHWRYDGAPEPPSTGEGFPPEK